MTVIACSTENMVQFRCRECGRLLAYLRGAAQVKCPRCGMMNVGQSGRPSKVDLPLKERGEV